MAGVLWKCAFWASSDSLAHWCRDEMAEDILKHFFVWKLLYFKSNFMNYVSKSIGSDYGLAPDRWQPLSELMMAWYHDDVINWKHFSHYWPFVQGIHRSPVNSPHKGQWHGALMFYLIRAWINGWVNNRKAGDLICHRAHYDGIVMILTHAYIHHSAWMGYEAAKWNVVHITDPLWGNPSVSEDFANKGPLMQKVSVFFY